MRMGGTVDTPLVSGTAGELGPSVLGSCPQQMIGSTSRMQGKEASEQELRNSTAGIDVSKDWLDAHVLSTSMFLRVANTSAGIRQLKRWLLKHEVKLVAIEATGKWHREACRSLSASSIAVAIVDPYRVLDTDAPHDRGSPVSMPRLNHSTRCAEVPCVNRSGMTRPVVIF